MVTSDVRSKKNATEEAAKAKWPQRPNHEVSPKSPLVTPKSEARSEISAKIGIYKVKVENLRVRCLTPLCIEGM